jgi:hypothetical protein|tara:strand:- start:590 stop:880 length:291 start_codon:yes stop_codon:yes gene_type:complete
MRDSITIPIEIIARAMAVSDDLNAFEAALMTLSGMSLEEGEWFEALVAEEEHIAEREERHLQACFSAGIYVDEEAEGTFYRQLIRKIIADACRGVR